ncbi:hypothetical protein ACVWZR_006790 [Bradyrhizobium sp. i1.3.1]
MNLRRGYERNRLNDSIMPVCCPTCQRRQSGSGCGSRRRRHSNRQIGDVGFWDLSRNSLPTRVLPVLTQLGPRQLRPRVQCCQTISHGSQLLLVADVIGADFGARTVLDRFVSGYVGRTQYRHLAVIALPRLDRFKRWPGQDGANCSAASIGFWHTCGHSDGIRLRLLQTAWPSSLCRPRFQPRRRCQSCY